MTKSELSQHGDWDETAGADIKSYSLEELRRLNEGGEVPPVPADAAGIQLDESFWAELEAVAHRRRKTSVHLRLDPDVVEGFKAEGPGHLTRMAQVLKAYVRSQRG